MPVNDYAITPSTQLTHLSPYFMIFIRPNLFTSHIYNNVSHFYIIFGYKATATPLDSYGYHFSPLLSYICMY